MIKKQVAWLEFDEYSKEMTKIILYGLEKNAKLVDTEYLNFIGGTKKTYHSTEKENIFYYLGELDGQPKALVQVEIVGE